MTEIQKAIYILKNIFLYYNSFYFSQKTIKKIKEFIKTKEHHHKCIKFINKHKKIKFELCGNIKNNINYPKGYWIFPCILCYMPCFNTFNIKLCNCIEIYLCYNCKIFEKNRINISRLNFKYVRLI